MLSRPLSVICLGIVLSLPSSSVALEKPRVASRPIQKDTGRAKNTNSEPVQSSKRSFNMQSLEQTKKATPEDSLLAHQAAVTLSLNAYRQNPSLASWQAAVKELEGYTRIPQSFRCSQASLFQAIPALAEIGTKIIDFPDGRLWNFSKVPESQEPLLQWQSASQAMEEVKIRGRRKIVRIVKVTLRSQLLPSTEQVHSNQANEVNAASEVKVKEARLVGPCSLITAGK